MEEKIVYTPEGVGLRMEPAGIGSRFMAMMLDMLIQAAVVIVLLLTFLLFGLENMFSWYHLTSWYIAVVILILFLLISGYFIILEWLMKGRTPGKALMKIRVVRTNGAPVDLSGCLVRNIFRLVDMLPTLYCIGILVMFSSSESRRIGDYVGGTLVIKERKKSMMLPTRQSEERNADKGMFPLSAAEYHRVKDFLTRRDELVASAREKLAKILAEKYWDRFAIPEQDRKEPERFLERIYRSHQ